MTEWLPVIQSVGIPAAILGLFFYAGWRVIPWLGTTCVMPIVNRHLTFVDGVESALKSVVDEFKGTSVDMRKMAESLGHLAAAQGRLSDSQAKFSDNAFAAAGKVTAASDAAAGKVTAASDAAAGKVTAASERAADLLLKTAEVTRKKLAHE